MCETIHAVGRRGGLRRFSKTRYKFDGRLCVDRIRIVTSSLSQKECRLYAPPVGQRVAPYIGALPFLIQPNTERHDFVGTEYGVLSAGSGSGFVTGDSEHSRERNPRRPSDRRKW